MNGVGQWGMGLAIALAVSGCSAITDFERFRAADAGADAPADAPVTDGSPEDAPANADASSDGGAGTRNG